MTLFCISSLNQVKEHLGPIAFSILTSSLHPDLKKTKDVENTIFLPSNLGDLLAEGEEQDQELARKVLLCATVRVRKGVLPGRGVLLGRGVLPGRGVLQLGVCCLEGVCC